MFDSIHRHIMAGYAVSIEFTKQGWRQFARLNASLGTRYIRASSSSGTWAEYIAAHEAAGVKLDTGLSGAALRRRRPFCCSRRFRAHAHHGRVLHGRGRCLCAGLYFWTRVRRGCNLLLARLITGWRSLTKALAERLVGA